VNGKRRRKVIYGKTRKQAAETLKTQYAQAARTNLASERITVRQFLERCSARSSAGAISPAPLMDIRRLEATPMLMDILS
jgi:hypothetical protein